MKATKVRPHSPRTIAGFCLMPKNLTGKYFVFNLTVYPIFRNASVRSVEIFLFHLKEKKLHQVTDLGGQNVYPSYHSNGRQFFFSSNFNKNSSTRSNIYIVDESGDNAEKVTIPQNTEFKVNLVFRSLSTTTALTCSRRSV
jgi:hypothetical protein